METKRGFRKISTIMVFMLILTVMSIILRTFFSGHFQVAVVHLHPYLAKHKAEGNGLSRAHLCGEASLDWA